MNSVISVQFLKWFAQFLHVLEGIARYLKLHNLATKVDVVFYNFYNIYLANSIWATTFGTAS